MIGNGYAAAVYNKVVIRVKAVVARGGVKLPPLISMSPFECTVSFVELTVHTAALGIKISEPAFKPFVLSSSSVVWVLPAEARHISAAEISF